MLKEDFWETLNELGDAFGLNLKEARIAVYWSVLKDIPSGDWTKAVQGLLRNADRFPTIKQILAAYADVRDDLNREDSGLGDPECKDCYGEGRIYFIRTFPDMKDLDGNLIPYEWMGRCAACASDRGNMKIAAVWRGRLEQNPNVIRILNQKPADKPLPRVMVSEKDLDVEFGVIDEAEEKYRREERLAILDEQRRSIQNE